MKCPKCGYNSFELLDRCKKCNHDLAAFKESLGIRSVVLPVRPAASPSAAPEIAAPLAGATAADTAEDTFDWTDPGEESAGAAVTAPSLADSPVAGPEESFNFGDFDEAAGQEAPRDDELSFADFSFEEAAAQPAQAPADFPAAESGDFADLLESSHRRQGQDSGAADTPDLPIEGFDDYQATFSLDSADTADLPAPATPGEFDFGDFSFDADDGGGENPPKKTGKEPAEPPLMEFDTLFGDDAGEEEKGKS